VKESKRAQTRLDRAFVFGLQRPAAGLMPPAWHLNKSITVAALRGISGYLKFEKEFRDTRNSNARSEMIKSGYPKIERSWNPFFVR
jgi:hypothetical protein